MLLYFRLCDGKTVLKKSHKYYTQCMLQMAVTGTIKSYFVVVNPHGMIILRYILIMNALKHKHFEVLKIKHEI